MFDLFLKTAEAAVVSNLPSIPLLDKINKVIINPFIYLMVGVSTVVFFWGVLQMMMNLGNDKAREAGKSHMIWGIVGLTIIVCVFGIMSLISRMLNAFS